MVSLMFSPTNVYAGGRGKCGLDERDQESPHHRDLVLKDEPKGISVVTVKTCICNIASVVDLSSWRLEVVTKQRGTAWASSLSSMPTSCSPTIFPRPVHFVE